MNTPSLQHEPDSKPPLNLQLGYAVALSLLFIVLYGLSNYYASTLTEHHVFRYEWERNIPFLPAFIIPYMSIDLFFFFSFFICTTRSELRTHAARLAATTITAAIIFVIFPMKLGMERPDPTGINGAVYAFLKSFDHPHNLCPSLHVAYTLILRMCYGRHTRGITWWVFHAWFTAVSLSVLFVHQHHVIDLIGGATLATLVMYFIPSHSRRIAMPPRRAGGSNPIAAAVYIALAAAIIIPVFINPYLYPLVWPAVALILVSLAYIHTGPRVFRKLNGNLPLNVRVIFAPYLIPLNLTRFLYNRATPPCAPITKNLWIARKLTKHEARKLIESNPTAYLDLTAEHTAPTSIRRLPNYRNIPMLDLTAPTPQQINAATEFIAAHTLNGSVVVQCGLGRSRSATVIAHYLLKAGQTESIEQAAQLIRSAQPKARINTAALRAALNQTG